MEPVAEPMFTAVPALAQLPPAVASVAVAVLPRQRLAGAVIAPGNALTVTVVKVAQPEPKE